MFRRTKIKRPLSLPVDDPKIERSARRVGPRVRTPDPYLGCSFGECATAGRRPTNHCLFNTSRLYRIFAPCAAPPVLTSKNEKGLFPRLLKLLAYADDIEIIGRSEKAVKEAFRALEISATNMGLHYQRG
ncbi:hypothetical protein TNCV_2377551 [Trichonephila clavipes]|nr:hypothetical protein TNCV_2377551 [Trichonephila clavipes]